MKNQSLYRELAPYYDFLYSKKNYEKEADKIIEIINRYKKSKGNNLLEVACGTGNYLHYFTKDFNCYGIDINQGVLDIAKRKVKLAKFKKEDMVNFSLGHKFDVIVCLFSSIGYVKTYSNLKKTIKNFSNHLEEGE